MRSVNRFLDSSLGKKVLMSVTGIFLCLFLVIHASGNLQLFNNDLGLAFNQYSVFMTTFLPIKIVSYVLYLSILLHVYNGFRLAFENKKARPVSYQSPKMPGSSSWSSSNMALLGFIVLVFLVTHMANFWFKYKFGDVAWVQYQIDPASGSVLGKSLYPSAPGIKPHEFLSGDAIGNPIKLVVIRDLYDVVKQAFSQTWIVVLYLTGILALSFHLVHGFQSAFQSLGLRHKSVAGIIRFTGIWVFGIILPLLFASMPVYFFFFS